VQKKKKKSCKVNGYTGGVAIDLEVATLPVSPLGSPHCRGISAKIEGYCGIFFKMGGIVEIFDFLRDI
jgi:hypothetical protein